MSDTIGIELLEKCAQRIYESVGPNWTDRDAVWLSVPAFDQDTTRASIAFLISTGKIEELGGAAPAYRRVVHPDEVTQTTLEIAVDAVLKGLDIASPPEWLCMNEEEERVWRLAWLDGWVHSKMGVR
jgi:hypothetical protein